MEEPHKDGGGDGGGEGAQQQQDTPAPATIATEKPLPATTTSGTPPLAASVEATEPVKHEPCSDASPHDAPVQNSSNVAAEMPAPTAMMLSQMSPAQAASQHQPSPRQLVIKIPFKSSPSTGKQTASSSPAGQQYGNRELAQGNTVGATSLLGDVGNGQTLDMASFGLANGLGSNTTFHNQGSSLNWQRQQPVQYPTQNLGGTTQYMPNFPHVGVGVVKYPSTDPAAAALRQSGANVPLSTEKVFHGLPNMNSLYNVSPRYMHGRQSLGQHLVSPQEMYYLSMQQTARPEAFPSHSLPQSLLLQTDGAQAKRKRRVVESDDEDEGELDKRKPSDHQGMQKSGESVKPKQKVPETYTIYEDAEEGDSSGNEGGLGSEVEEVGEEQEADEDDVEDNEEVISEADEEGAAGASHEDESEDDEPLASRLRTSALPNQKPSASFSEEIISWKLPQYEVQGLPPSKKDEDPMAQISLPGCVREKIILSHDHAEQELHLFKEVFLPSHESLAKPDDAPTVAILNFHHVCVMVLDAYYAHQTGDLEPSDGLSAGPRRTQDNLKWKDAREVDEDEIFFAVIDRWRTGLSRNPPNIHRILSIDSAPSILKPAYAFIRGAQEFCDIALDIIHYIKNNGMLQEPPSERAPRSDKGVKRTTPVVGGKSSNTAPPKQTKTPVPKAGTSKSKSVASTGNSAKVANASKKTSSGKDVGTKSNPHRPSTRKRAKTVAPRKEKLGISVTRRT